MADFSSNDARERAQHARDPSNDRSYDISRAANVGGERHYRMLGRAAIARLSQSSEDYTENRLMAIGRRIEEYLEATAPESALPDYGEVQRDVFEEHTSGDVVAINKRIERRYYEETVAVVPTDDLRRVVGEVVDADIAAAEAASGDAR